MGDISSLYPQAPQPQQGALSGNPLQLLGAMGQVNALRAFESQQAVGNAYQNALNPDGTVNQQTLVQGLKDPAAAYAAPQAIGTMLDQRRAQIANDTAQFQLNTAQDTGIRDAIGAMAQDPTLTPTKAIGTIVGLARNRNIPPNVWASVLATMPQTGNPADLQKWAAGIGNIAVGAGPSAARVGAVDPTTGQPITITQGRANITGALPTGLPPGQGEALAANQTAFVNDQSRAASTLASVRPLQLAFPLVQQLSPSSFGPGSEGFNKVKAGLITAGVISPNTTDAEVRQEVGKYLNAYAGIARGADRSDQGLSQALKSNPNLDLTQGANLALLKNQIGLDRMDAALPVAFQAQHPNATDKSQYLTYKSNFYQNNDSRAFSFDLMTPDERRKVIDSLGPQSSPAFKKFSRSYQLAKQAGIITPTQAPQGQ